MTAEAPARSKGSIGSMELPGVVAEMAYDMAKLLISGLREHSGAAGT
jgi:hypothetical protein